MASNVVGGRGRGWCGAAGGREFFFVLRQWRRERGILIGSSVAGARERETQARCMCTCVMLGTHMGMVSLSPYVCPWLAADGGQWAGYIGTQEDNLLPAMHVSKPPTKAKESHLRKRKRRGERRGIARHTQSKKYVKQKARCLLSAIIASCLLRLCGVVARVCVLFTYILLQQSVCGSRPLAASFILRSADEEMHNCTPPSSASFIFLKNPSVF